MDTYGASPGIDALAGDQRARIATVGLIPLETFAVSIGASTVAYVDNQLGMNGELPLYGLSRRSFGKALALPAQVGLGQVGRPMVTRDDGIRTKAFDSIDRTAQAGAGDPNTFRLPGHRLLWVKGDYSSPHNPSFRLMLYDVRTALNTDLGPYSYGRPVTLWGSYLVYADASNRIPRKDLSSGAVVQVKGAGTARVAGLDVYGSRGSGPTRSPG